MGAKDISKTMTLKDGVSGTLQKINAGTVQYKKNLEDLKETGGDTWDSLKSGMISIQGIIAAVAAAALGTAGIISTFGVGLEAAKDLESYRLTLNTVMKDTEKAGKLMKWASNFANITPFDTKEVVEGTVRLQSYGISAQATMQSIGDMASVMNTDLMQAIEAVADAQTGELERMKEFGITKAMIQKKSDDMFKKQTTINNKGQIVNQQQFNQALFALMDERFKGGMEKQASTFKGLMSTITGTWQTGLAALMGVGSDGIVKAGGLFDTIKNSAAGAAKALQQMADDGTFERWGNNLMSIYNAAASVVDFFKTAWPKISPIIYGVVAGIVAYKAAIFAVRAYTLATTAAIWLMTVSQIGLNAAMRANPYGWIAVLIGLLVTASIYLVKNWDTVKLAGMQTWNAVVEVAQWAVNKYFLFANFMLKVYKFAWDSIAYAGISIWDGILSAGEAGVNGFIGLVNGMVNTALGGINSLIRGANSISKKLGLGKVVNELSFGGLNKVSFDGAKATAEKPVWDSALNPLPQVDFGGAKFSDDSIAAQTKKAHADRDKKNEKKDKDTQAALNANTEALNQNTTATGQNTNATKAALKESLSPLDLADSLLNRIERHLYSTS